jgi:hypothetical protein
MNILFKNSIGRIIVIIIFIFHTVDLAAQDSSVVESELLGIISASGRVSFIRSSQTGLWGINIEHPGGASATAESPVQIEHYTGEMKQQIFSLGYSTIEKTADIITGTGQIHLPCNVFLDVTDKWTIRENQLHLARNIKVSGNAYGGFFSKISLSTSDNYTLPDVDVFMPGMIYGRSEYLYDFAPAGRNNYNRGFIEEREDAFPIPLAGLFFRDGTSLLLFNPEPDGNTTSEDTQDRQGQTLIDKNVKVGGLGVFENQAGGIDLSYWFPGSKYNRRRYHPLEDGTEQSYKIIFRFGDNETFHEFYSNSWRWAWNFITPAFKHYDIDMVQRSLTDHLAGLVLSYEDRTGIPFWSSMTTGKNFGDAGLRDRDAVMGFVGKSCEGAALLLMNSYEDKSARGQNLRKKALDIINSFVKYVEVDPPSGSGFNIETGKPTMTNPSPNHVPCCNGRVYLRAFTDDMRWVLKAYQWEKERGIEHYDWFRWCTAFGEWLLKHGYGDGAFPRSWYPGTGEIYDESDANSYNVMAFLVKLGEVTGREVFWTAEGVDPFVSAAIKAGEFSWKNYHSKELYIGGTLDNNNILDKEAGTLSLEGYLALYEVTGDVKWLNHARTSADYAETWIYAWDVPMPVDETDEQLQWERGVSTIGVNKINSHSGGVDQWMAGDVDEYARLYAYTKDEHYLDIARIQLHNSKNMLALPGRLYDYYEPGAQQEHWGISIFRGHARHRGALPWVTVNHLTGIMALKEFDMDLFKKLSEEKK